MRFEDRDAGKAARRPANALFEMERESRSFKNRSLLNQMLKCIDSGMANVVEGLDSGSDRGFLRFLKIAFRSNSGFQSHLHPALDGRCVDRPTCDRLYPMSLETKSLMGGFMRCLKKCIRRSEGENGPLPT